jgi:hypothetical protein
MDWLNKLIDWAGKSLSICLAAVIGSVAALHWWVIPQPYDWIPRGLTLVLGPYVVLVGLGRMWGGRSAVIQWWRRHRQLSDMEEAVLVAFDINPAQQFHVSMLLTDIHQRAEVVAACIELEGRGLLFRGDDQWVGLTTDGQMALRELLREMVRRHSRK